MFTNLPQNKNKDKECITMFTNLQQNKKQTDKNMNTKTDQKNTQKDKNERMRVSYKTEGIGFEEEKEKVVPNMSA